MSEPGATPTGGGIYHGPPRYYDDTPLPGATPQPERLSADEIGERWRALRTVASRVADNLTGNEDPILRRDRAAIYQELDQGVPVASLIDALCSTIAQLEAERNRTRKSYVAEVRRLLDEAAADAPKLQAAERWASAFRANAAAVGDGEARALASLLDAEDALAALFPDPEHTGLSEVWRNSANDETAKPGRTVDMAGRPVGELATRTLDATT